ncbi:hypothetical protein FRX31_032558 [Thalictrum thalictroides]|uniref:Uncharacterized protein n=1 Tax=Thalictrum thalictroides TaxID=46969 RepID=A0A7J6V0S1_THATH|nr:hypothetical protein FRX31_032558 [Thalictrum thalictroides]
MSDIMKSTSIRLISQEIHVESYVINIASHVNGYSDLTNNIARFGHRRCNGNCIVIVAWWQRRLKAVAKVHWQSEKLSISCNHDYVPYKHVHLQMCPAMASKQL